MKQGTLVIHRQNLMLYRVVKEVKRGFLSWLWNPYYELTPLHPKLCSAKIVARNSEIDKIVD